MLFIGERKRASSNRISVFVRYDIIYRFQLHINGNLSALLPTECPNTYELLLSLEKELKGMVILP